MAVIFYMLSDIGLSLTIPFALGATLFITIEFIAEGSSRCPRLINI